jgi:hypothetical protein
VRPPLWVAIASGAVMIAIELYPTVYRHQVCALFVREGGHGVLVLLGSSAPLLAVLVLSHGSRAPACHYSARHAASWPVSPQRSAPSEPRVPDRARRMAVN